MITQKKFNRLVKKLRKFIYTKNTPEFPGDVYTEFCINEIWVLWSEKVQHEMKDFSLGSLTASRKIVFNDFVKDCRKKLIGKIP